MDLNLNNYQFKKQIEFISHPQINLKERSNTLENSQTKVMLKLAYVQRRAQNFSRKNYHKLKNYSSEENLPGKNIKQNKKQYICTCNKWITKNDRSSINYNGALSPHFQISGISNGNGRPTVKRAVSTIGCNCNGIGF